MGDGPQLESTSEDRARGADGPRRILIVEDDVTLEPLWRYIIEVATPGAVVDWLTSAEAAETALRTRSYDLVISDIFLNGQKTGVDLWESSGLDHFLLMSVLTPSRLATLALDSKRSLPPYLQKPIDVTQSIASVRALLGQPI